MPMRPPAGFISAFYDPLKNPNPPTGLTATGGNTSASIAFTPPTDVGGSAISSYTAISTPGAFTGSAASSPVTVTGLTNGTAYTFAMWATNTYGPSAFSAASGSVTPAVPTFLANLYNGQSTSVATDSSSNIYVAGFRQSVNYLEVAKYNSEGVLQWQKEFDFSATTGKKIRIDNSGNVLVAMSNSSEIRVIKLTPAGAIIWQKNVYGWPSGCGGVQVGYVGVCSDTANNVYLAASPTYTNCLYTYSITKLDSSGNVQWSRYLQNNMGASDFGVSIAADSSGNVYAVGSALMAGGGYYKAYLVKYDTSGNLQWQRGIGSGESVNSNFAGVAVDSSGYVYVAGIWGVSNRQALIAKYDSSGTLQWNKTIGAGTPTYGTGLAIDSSSNVYITGQYLFDYRMIMVKYNSSGTLQWQREIISSTTRRSYGYDVSVDANGNPIFLGYNEVGSSDLRFFIWKLPPDGSKTGTYTLSGTTWTYQASSFTDATPSPVYFTSGPTSTSVSLSTSNSSVTANNSSLTTGTTNLV